LQLLALEDTGLFWIKGFTNLVLYQTAVSATR